MAELQGKFCLGIGQGTGWKDIDLDFQVSRAHGTWIQMLDGVPAAEIYSRIFSYRGPDWMDPPLTDLARIYCLGIENAPWELELSFRSSLHIEVDGGLRINAVVTEGQKAHLLIGDRDACLEAARQAVKQALQSLGKARPLLALILIEPGLALFV